MQRREQARPQRRRSPAGSMPQTPFAVRVILRGHSSPQWFSLSNTAMKEFLLTANSFPEFDYFSCNAHLIALSNALVEHEAN